MEKYLSSDIAKEILTVLAFCEDDFRDKIPNDIIKELTYLAADSNREYFIDSNKDLASQNLSDECLDYLSVLYLNYLDY